MSSNITPKPRREKKSRPLRPTSPSTVGVRISRTNAPAALITFVLNAPHSPLSAVTTIKSVLLSGPIGRIVSSGWIDGSTRDATRCNTRCICTAYGRAFMMRSCARRSFDAATIFIALVICCVFLTARIRRRRSMSDGIRLSGSCLSGREALRELLDRRLECRLERIVELLLLADIGEHFRIPRFDEEIQLRLEVAHLGDGNRIEVAVRAGIDDRHLALDRQRLVLRLLQHFDEPRAARQLLLRRLVEVAAELRERRQRAVLREREPQRAGDLAHRLDLRVAADARHRVADV